MKILLACGVAAALVACTDTTDDGNNKNHGGDGPGAGGDSMPAGDQDPGPGTFTIETTACPGFTPCGLNSDDIAGTWYYGSGCITQDEIQALLGSFCSTAVLNSVTAGPITGRATFTASTSTTGSVTRSATGNFDVDVTIPSACSSDQCGFVQLLIQSQFDPNGMCTGATDCACVFTYPLVFDETGSYSISGNTLTVDTTHTYDFCISGGELDYSNTSNEEPGEYVLVR